MLRSVDPLLGAHKASLPPPLRMKAQRHIKGGGRRLLDGVDYPGRRRSQDARKTDLKADLKVRLYGGASTVSARAMRLST